MTNENLHPVDLFVWDRTRFCTNPDELHHSVSLEDRNPVLEISLHKKVTPEQRLLDLLLPVAPGVNLFYERQKRLDPVAQKKLMRMLLVARTQI
jgi:hypothetical protein